jgi:hypothetical protein
MILYHTEGHVLKQGVVLRTEKPCWMIWIGHKNRNKHQDTHIALSQRRCGVELNNGARRASRKLNV